MSQNGNMDGTGPALTKCPSRLAPRAAGREDVVHQQDGQSGKPCASGRRERPPDVGPPFRFGQFDLGRCRSDPPKPGGLVAHSQQLRNRDRKCFSLVIPSSKPSPPMKGDGNDDPNTQSAEAICVLAGPEFANALGQLLTGRPFHGQDSVPQWPVIRTKADRRVKVVPLVSATRAPFRHIGEFTDRACASRTGEVRIDRQRLGALTTEVVGRPVNERFAPGTNDRIDELTEASDQIDQHGRRP